MTDLTAIDILIDPDQALVSKAKAVNARMLESVPSGFALDEHHRPHITTLQRYVRSADLDRVFDAVGGDPHLLEPVLGVDAAYLHAALDEVKQRFGGLDAYFADGLGIDADGQQRLRDTLVES